jgi:hypothetical protein
MYFYTLVRGVGCLCVCVCGTVLHTLLLFSFFPAVPCHAMLSLSLHHSPTQPICHPLDSDIHFSF